MHIEFIEPRGDFDRLRNQEIDYWEQPRRHNHNLRHTFKDRIRTLIVWSIKLLSSAIERYRSGDFYRTDFCGFY